MMLIVKFLYRQVRDIIIFLSIVYKAKLTVVGMKNSVRARDVLKE